jgi:hypothetical protein
MYIHIFTYMYKHIYIGFITPPNGIPSKSGKQGEYSNPKNNCICNFFVILSDCILIEYDNSLLGHSQYKQ